MAAAGQQGMTFRIVLLGKTGNGKSSLGNALLGKETPEGDEVSGGPNGFKVGKGIQSKTTECDWGKAARFDMTFEVTDTPGLCDTYMDERKIYKELAKSVAVARPGPNIILFVLRADRRFTTEELEAYQTIKALFSEKISDYLLIVFNGIDELCSTKSIAEQRKAHKADVDSFIKLPSKNAKALSTMLAEAGGRYFGMNNKTRPAVVETQIKDLVGMMQDLVKKNGNTIYKTEMTEEINLRVDELVRQQAMPQFSAVTHRQATAQTPAVTQAQPEPDIQTRIVNEDVPKGFFESVGDMIYRGFKKIKRAASDMCSMM